MARLVVARLKEDRKVLEDPSDSRARDRKGQRRGRSRARDGPSSSQVCFKCGSNNHWARDCPKMGVGPSNLKIVGGLCLCRAKPWSLRIWCVYLQQS